MSNFQAPLIQESPENPPEAPKILIAADLLVLVMGWVADGDQIEVEWGGAIRLDGEDAPILSPVFRRKP